MEQQSKTNILNLFNSREKHLKEFMNQAIESEFKILELNLFLSSIGKDKLNNSTKKVKELRKKIDSGKINLSEYENLLN